jgi:SAM-dependent methyltransferase
VSTIAYYDEHADEFYADTVGAEMGGFYDAFLPLLPVGGRILDAGCGSGRDSRAFLERGYAVTAFDASAALGSRAARLLSRPVLQLTFQEMAFAEEFDGVWACASLLHVPRAELDGVLARLARALVPGGAAFLSFKYGDGEGERDGAGSTAMTRARSGRYWGARSH